jgi:hypothetical protein
VSSVLLRHAYGFERLSFSGERAVANDLSGAKRVDPRSTRAGCRTAALACHMQPAQYADAVVGKVGDRVTREIQLEVLAEQPDNRRDISTSKGCIPPLNDLHVLLRNTPSPSPQYGYFMGRV